MPFLYENLAENCRTGAAAQRPFIQLESWGKKLGDDVITGYTTVVGELCTAMLRGNVE